MSPASGESLGNPSLPGVASVGLEHEHQGVLLTVSDGIRPRTGHRHHGYDARPSRGPCLGFEQRHILGDRGCRDQPSAALVFRCKPTGGQLTLNDEVTAFRWATANGIAEDVDEAFAVRVTDAWQTRESRQCASTTAYACYYSRTGKRRPALLSGMPRMIPGWAARCARTFLIELSGRRGYRQDLVRRLGLG